MDKYRLELIKKGFSVKLTPKESKNGGYKLYLNPSWLMEDRGELKYTHPHYPGPFIMGHTTNYHIYCSLELWESMEGDPKYHWDYRGDNESMNYKPSNMTTAPNYGPLLPTVQRKRVCHYFNLGAEIFNDFHPFYC